MVGAASWGAGASAVQSVILEHQRLMSPHLCPKGGGPVIGAAHPLPSLVIEAEDTRPFAARFKGGGTVLLIPDPSCGGACFRTKARRDEGLLFHSGLRPQRSGYIIEVTHLIPLVGGKSNDAIPPCGHSAVASKGGRNISGQVSIAAIEALCHKGLHLHIGGSHESPGHTPQVYGFLSLVYVESEDVLFTPACSSSASRSCGGSSFPRSLALRRIPKQAALLK